MQGEFLELIISGEKSIESRFTKNRVAPVGNVEAGDLVLFKQVGRELFAVALVEKAKDGVLDDTAWSVVRRHADDIGIDEEYIEYKSDARYYVLVWVKDVHVIPPIRLEKRDRRAWVVLRDRLR
jgi:ASC-1-like (ASCH) protein